jgi:hypothetical protein
VGSTAKIAFTSYFSYSHSPLSGFEGLSRDDRCEVHARTFFRNNFEFMGRDRIFNSEFRQTNTTYLAHSRRSRLLDWIDDSLTRSLTHFDPHNSRVGADDLRKDPRPKITPAGMLSSAWRLFHVFWFHSSDCLTWRTKHSFGGISWCRNYISIE